ncbi:MAG: hypothetical protein JSW38_10295 [Dehalococcoidia bacterium]|nr:MAG: hypothetical protein JSW38_10295 [Dehalococcoidia bacterium]
MKKSGLSGNQNPNIKVNEWQSRIAYALKHLGDRSILNCSPLARLAYIDRLAREQYKGHLLPRGLALHDALISCVETVLREVGNERGLVRACAYLKLLVEGRSCAEISKQIGLSREHVSRIYRKKAVELVTEEFLYTIKNGELLLNT